MSRLIVALAGLVSGAGIALVILGHDASAQTQSPNVMWEQSESVSVRLALKGREWEADRVVADCYIDGPKQKNAAVRSTRKWSIARDQQQSLYFPEDFQRKPLPGEYEWGCTVGGRTIGRGRFEYTSPNQARVLGP